MKLSDLKAHVAKKQPSNQACDNGLIEVIDKELLDNVAGAIAIWGRWGMAFSTTPDAK